MATANQAVTRRSGYVTRGRRWARRSLFSDRSNTLITLVALPIVGFAAYSLIRFAGFTADWEAIEANRRLLAIGRLPAGGEDRVWAALWFVAAAGGAGFGLWVPVGRRGLLVLASALLFMFGWLAEGDAGLRMAMAGMLLLVGYAAARAPLETDLAGRLRGLSVAAAAVFGLGLLTIAIAGDLSGPLLVGAVLAGGLTAAYTAIGLRATARVEGATPALLVQSVAAGLVVSLPVAVVMLTAADGVKTTLWSGILLNVMLAVVGIAGGFAFGLVLALGRASTMPVFRYAATAYIELVRAAPLIAWLFVARFVLPDFLPTSFDLDQLDIVIRAMIVLAGFTAAYIAEIVRGGLQSLPRGQVEAAHAIGLNTVQTTTLIVLPQALRAVIPALVSQFISLWKDTSLVFVLGFIDFFGAGQAILAQVEYLDSPREVLAFVAFGFWVVAYSMSRLSLRLERTLGVGEH